MNTLFLETKEDAISLANEINETFWKFGKEAATDSALGWKFRPSEVDEWVLKGQAGDIESDGSKKGVL